MRFHRSIVSVLRAWRRVPFAEGSVKTSTFGLWHASGYQKRSKL